jgi:hypothetical protein
MSWSVNFIGTRDNIIKALNEHSEKLTGDSKKEYDSCLSDLTNLVSANYNNNGIAPALKLTAHGHRAEGMSSFGITLEHVGSSLV